ncbi:MAG TPA: PLDc N-terminal domain-containing protein [Candidatus Nanoarchaeia archaeon]|nr:PLDc N-terminal domain-containing protein [Candidatus Nanoarchaeia archaeon]
MGLFSFPFASAFMFAGLLVGIVLVIFWILMIVDCAKRRFKAAWEKIIWIVIMLFATWIGALAYFIVVKSLNPRGILS